MRIFTRRLVLRRWNPDDVRPLAAIMLHPDVCPTGSSLEARKSSTSGCPAGVVNGGDPGCARSAPALTPDRHAKQRAGAERRATLLAFDLEGGREPRAARWTAVNERRGAGRTARGQLVLGVVEVAQRVATVDTERDPVAKRPATLLLDPVALRSPGLGHPASVIDGFRVGRHRQEGLRGEASSAVDTVPRVDTHDEENRWRYGKQSPLARFRR